MNYVDYLVVLAFMGGFLMLGYFFKNNKGGKDYFLGGKSFGWFPLSLSTAATQLSAISFVSAPAFVGFKENGGMKWLTFEFGVPLAMIFLMIFLIPPIYKAGVVSVYAYLEKRFDTSTRVMISIVFQISRAFAASVMLYTVALILTSVMALPVWATILIIGVVTLIYSYQGGMKAVVYGDVIQMIILFVGILICLFVGIYHIGGWENFVTNVSTDRLQAVNFESLGFSEGDDFGFWPMLLGGFFLYVSYYGTDQMQVQRLLSARDMKTVKQTLFFNGIMRFPITLLYCIMGLVVGTLAVTDASFLANVPLDKPDLLIPVFIRDYLPHGLIGVLMVAIFSAAMSSISSAINSLSAATVEDLIVRGDEEKGKHYLKYSKRAALVWGIICITLAFFTGDIAKTVIEAINKVGSVFYGPILATFIAAVAIKKVNATGAKSGLIAGVLVNVYLWQFVPEVFWFWWNAIGTFVTLTVAIIVSQVSKEPAKGTDTLSLKVESYEPTKTITLILFFALIVLISYFIPQLI